MKMAFLLSRRSAGALLALLISIALTGRAQTPDWLLQNFDGNICGWNSFNPTPVTLVFDPTQDNTGDGGGSCHVKIDWTQSGFYSISGSYEDCCACASELLLMLSNYASLDFDLKWDTSATVTPAQFNSNSGSGSAGLSITTGYLFVTPTVCYSNVFIPDSATNGWVHICAPINPTSTYATNHSTGIDFVGVIPAGGQGTAAFWLDNVKLTGRKPPLMTPAMCRRSGSNFTMQWTANPGDVCTVLKSTDLIHWSALTNGYPAGGLTGNTAAFTDTAATNLQSYYRIQDP